MQSFLGLRAIRVAGFGLSGLGSLLGVQGLGV